MDKIEVSNIHHSSRPFNYIHHNLWDFTIVSTHERYSYFLAIIDDLSRRV